MIRDATPDDASAIATVHLGARTEGYGHLLDASYNASLTLEGYIADWRKRLTETHRRTLVGERDGEVRGFTRFGSAPNAPEPFNQGGVIELIYVLPGHWGTGLGPALLTAAEEGLTAMGFGSVFLVVYEENHRARAFYERNGWAADGARWEVNRGSPVAQVRYVKTL